MKFKSSKWLDVCEEINNSGGRKFFSQINKLTKYKQKSHIPTIEENGVEYSTDAEKTQIFAETLKQLYVHDVNPDFDDETLNLVTEWHNQFFQHTEINEVLEINEEEYFKILDKQKNTAPGMDNIPWPIVKKLDYDIHLYIIKMYEFCLNNHHFPDIWKKGQIIVIPKPNTEHTKTENYRPITLLPVLGKLFEKIIKGRILDCISEKIPAFQFGFKEKCSTLHPITILMSNVQSAKLDNLKSAAVFLDIKKAFDSVWHLGLLYKLSQLEIPTYLIYILRSFLEERNLYVKINNSLSDGFVAEQGLPQGSALSPVLYNIYCHDIFSSEIEPNSYLLQYADDTTLISHDKTLTKTIDNLQTMINDTEKWFKTWRLQLNPNKARFIIFNHRISMGSPYISILNTRIQPSLSAKYLGIDLDHKCNLKQHTKLLKRRITTRAKLFRSLTYKKEGISTQSAAKIYKSICRPLLEFGHTLYLNCRNSILKNIQVAETSALRIITKMRHPRNPLHKPSNNHLYDVTKVSPIQERLNMLSKKFAQRPHNFLIMNPLLRTRTTPRPRCRFPERTIQEILNSLQQAN